MPNNSASSSWRDLNDADQHDQAAQAPTYMVGSDEDWDQWYRDHPDQLNPAPGQSKKDLHDKDEDGLAW